MVRVGAAVTLPKGEWFVLNQTPQPQCFRWKPLRGRRSRGAIFREGENLSYLIHLGADGAADKSKQQKEVVKGWRKG